MYRAVFFEVVSLVVLKLRLFLIVCSILVVDVELNPFQAAARIGRRFSHTCVRSVERSSPFCTGFAKFSVAILTRAFASTILAGLLVLQAAFRKRLVSNAATFIANILPTLISFFTVFDLALLFEMPFGPFALLAHRLLLAQARGVSSIFRHLGRISFSEISFVFSFPERFFWQWLVLCWIGLMLTVLP